MKKFYCVICCKYRKLEKLKYLLENTLVLSIICKDEDEKILKEEKSIEISKYKIMHEENKDQEFRLKQMK